MASLKSKNTPLIVLYIIWCVALFFTVYIYTENFLVEIQNNFSTLNAKDGMFIALSPIITLVLTGIISPINKARIVFWRIKNPLPGSRVFSELAPLDERIVMNELEERLGGLPVDPKEQNKVWYRIFKQEVEELPSVKSYHQKFLLSRDLCIIALLFTVFGLIGAGVLESAAGAMLFSLLVVTQYFVFVHVTRNLGNRFVCNVLAEYINQQPPQC